MRIMMVAAMMVATGVAVAVDARPAEIAAPGEAAAFQARPGARVLPNPAFIGSEDRSRGVAINRAYLDRLMALRTAYLDARAAGGGTISAAARAAIQARLERVNADWRLSLRDIDPFSVDARGVAQ